MESNKAQMVIVQVWDFDGGPTINKMIWKETKSNEKKRSDREKKTMSNWRQKSFS